MRSRQLRPCRSPRFDGFAIGWSKRRDRESNRQRETRPLIASDSAARKWLLPAPCSRWLTTRWMGEDAPNRPVVLAPHVEDQNLKTGIRDLAPAALVVSIGSHHHHRQIGSPHLDLAQQCQTAVHSPVHPSAEDLSDFVRR